MHGYIKTRAEFLSISLREKYCAGYRSRCKDTIKTNLTYMYRINVNKVELDSKPLKIPLLNKPKPIN